ncbi:septum formation initiator family protein [Marinicella sp. S1101]|uniref:septum formation initiator family protein n=1 Tax=Marinicella marina TaxID=2996016 RepID=UPI0024BD1C84|nr:septum formation initiator family protein [Marinicella marina]MCX7552308.1 septum formation initiator family protein [Marinicella marina]MDJ1139183.1 septum formation initiator family protein [Marinicella marina]
MKWLNIILAILIVWALFQQQFGDGGRKELKAKQLLLESQQVEIEQLKQRNEQLAAEVSSLKTGLDAIEERARSELGMIKEGETFIQVINQSDQDGN